MRKILFLMLLSLSFLFFQSGEVYASHVFSISNVQAYPNCTGTGLLMTYVWYRYQPIVNYTGRIYVDGSLVYEGIDLPGDINFWNFGASPYNINAYADPYGATAANAIYKVEMIFNGEKFSVSWNCTTGQIVGGGGGADDAPVYPPDNRLNPTFGDGHLAILYPNANGGIDVYLYAEDQYLSDFISEADVQAGFTRTSGSVTVLVLEDERIQFTLGPDSEVKIYTITFDDLAGSNPVGSYYDPNE
jgi:hypothetical protein